MKRFSSILALAVLALVPAQLTAGWSQTYEYKVGNAIHQTTLQTPDGGYFLIGADYRTYPSGSILIKTDEYGNVEWTHDYLEDSRVLSACLTSDGGYALTGFVNDEDYFGDLYVLKTDSEGVPLWQYIHSPNYPTDVGNCICEANDGELVVAGEDGHFVSVLLIKVNVWVKEYFFKGYPGCVKETLEGGYIIVGNYRYSNGLWLLKTDSLGDSLWFRTYEIDNYKNGCWVEQTSDGGYIVVGGAGDEHYKRDLLLMKTDSLGEILWSKTYGGEYNDYGYHVEQTSDEGYIITGQRGNPLLLDRSDLWLLKTDSFGDTLWTRTYGSERIDAGNCVQPLADGGYIVAGGFSGGGSYTDGDLWLIKTDSVGIVAITEQPSVPVTQPDWQITTPVGRRIVLRYQDCPQGFHVDIYNAAGRKVDELHSNQTSGTVSWGEGHSPGVYFIVPETQGAVRAQKVVLLR